MELLSLAIFVLHKKSVNVDGEDFSIEYDHKHTSVLLSLFLSSGSSVQTIKAISKLPSMRYKDALPISRSVVEGCINSAYILAEGTEATDNAIAHAMVKGFRKLEGTTGTGGHKISFKSVKQIKIDSTLQRMIDAFSTKKGFQKNWTELSVPQRIVTIEKSFGARHALSLNGAYMMVYSDASEIIHGSYFGALLSSGMPPYGNSPKDLAEFTLVHEQHLENSLLASFLALMGMLNVFAEHFSFEQFSKKLEENMDEFILLIEEYE